MQAAIGAALQQRRTRVADNGGFSSPAVFLQGAARRVDVMDFAQPIIGDAVLSHLRFLTRPSVGCRLRRDDRRAGRILSLKKRKIGTATSRACDRSA